MPRILVTNDDGVHSPGLKSLADALSELGDVIVVAPPAEASAIGHALTLRRPLRLELVAPGMYVVDGTPTDCVNLGVAAVLKGPPALVVSGINKGWNLGDDITYSGTVAGALEGALLGIPSLAISLERTDGEWDFTHAAQAAVRLARAVLRHGLPPRTFLNVNVPRGRPKGVRVTVQGRRQHATSVIEKLDPRRQPYYWIEEGENHWEPHDRSDYEAVVNGWISVTPLHSDLTNYAALAAIEALSESWPGG